MIFAFKEFERYESDLDDEDIAVISKKLKKNFKKGGKLWEKIVHKQRKEFGNAMYTGCRINSDNSNEDDAEDMSLMEMEDPKSDTEWKKWAILKRKNWKKSSY